MDYLIAPTLFQNKTCRLPGIGTLSVITGKAATDFVKSSMSAPFPSIIFSAAQKDENVFNEFSALSELIKKELDEKGNVTIKSVGDFTKNDVGGIVFIPQQVNKILIPAVVAERVVRKATEHVILVGDKETTNFEMSGYFVEEDNNDKVKGHYWWIGPVVLGLVAAGIICYYIMQHGFNLFGNDAAY
jgi:hypothetical protein